MIRCSVCDCPVAEPDEDGDERRLVNAVQFYRVNVGWRGNDTTVIVRGPEPDDDDDVDEGMLEDGRLPHATVCEPCLPMWVVGLVPAADQAVKDERGKPPEAER